MSYDPLQTVDAPVPEELRAPFKAAFQQAYIRGYLKAVDKLSDAHLGAIRSMQEVVESNEARLQILGVEVITKDTVREFLDKLESIWSDLPEQLREAAASEEIT